METAKELLQALWAYDGVRLIVAGVMLNTVLAVALAVRNNDFSLRVIGEFLYRQLLPYTLTYYAFRLMADGTGFEWVAQAVWGLIAAMISAAIADKLHQLGVQLPDHVVRVVRRPPTYLYVVRGERDAAHNEAHDERS